VKILNTTFLSFDDVLIQPGYSDIDSREEIDVKVDFLGHRLYPIISANMDYVTGVKMAEAMWNNSALGIINRFEDMGKQWLSLSARYLYPIAISVGIRDWDDTFGRITHFNPHIVCIDVAHGHHKNVVNTIYKIKGMFPKIKIIAGNVATAEGTYALIQAGADAIKVGIGPGSACTTREVTGAGVPQLSAILECADAAKPYQIPIIADGGINSSGDIVKALAAGADMVMLGRLLAGHDETPGEKITLPDGRQLKPYRGQSTLGVNGSTYAPEGVSGYVPARGPVSETLKTLIGGIRSGFSYVGARDLEELRQNATFIHISEATKRENGTRILLEV
jgi:guanosine monophosphate reductase